jgi:hypothetical protein
VTLDMGSGEYLEPAVPCAECGEYVLVDEVYGECRYCAEDRGTKEALCSVRCRAAHYANHTEADRYEPSSLAAREDAAALAEARWEERSGS